MVAPKMGDPPTLQNQPPTKRVVFIMGMAHSGSTLLELILASHSHVFGLGELYALREKMSAVGQDRPRLCSICEGECDYWDHKAPYLQLARYFSNSRPFAPIIRLISHYRRSLYQSLFEWFGHDILVDSSKRVPWIQRQLSPSYHWREMTPILLYITRDGRAVVNSYLRKYPEESIERVTVNWKKSVQQMNDFFQRFRFPKYRIPYETLATEPQATAKALCTFLKIDYEPEMLQYWKHDHHPCNGNLGTRSLIYRYRAQLGTEPRGWTNAREELKTSHGDYYDQLGLAIKLDLRWKRELSRQQLEIFESIAGDLNRPLAYLPEGKRTRFPAEST